MGERKGREEFVKGGECSPPNETSVSTIPLGSLLVV